MEESSYPFNKASGAVSLPTLFLMINVQHPSFVRTALTAIRNEDRAKQTFDLLANEVPLQVRIFSYGLIQF